jgi:hypothetical protein
MDKEDHRYGNKGRGEVVMVVEGKDHWKGRRKKER